MAFYSQFSVQIPNWPPFLRPHDEVHQDWDEIVSQKDVKELRQQLGDLSAAGIISPFDATRHVPKGTRITKMYRMSYDYVWFTKRSIPNLYDDRSVQNILNCLIGYKEYSTIALVSNLSQVPMYPGERTQPYSVRPNGFYDGERMQPGYVKMLTDFQKMVSTILKDYNMVDLVVILDYVIVFASSEQEHAERLARALEIIQSAGLKVDLDRSVFSNYEVMYAGHSVQDVGAMVSMDDRYLLLNWPLPRTVVELQSYLEVCAYYRHFYQGFSTMATPLYRLLHSVAQAAPKEEPGQPKKPWWTRASLEEKWTQECSDVFHQLKDVITKAPDLKRVDMSRGR